MLRFSYVLILLACIFPTLIGLAGVFLSSLSYIPPLELNHLHLSAFSQVFQWQGIWHSLLLSAVTAIVSTYIACFITFSILQATWGNRFWRYIQSTLSVLVAMPHVAFAIGFAFLFAPTGLGMRVMESLAIWPIDHQDQSLSILVKDPYGLGLICVLALKEVPFLLLMSIGVLQQMNVSQIEKVSASLGYNRAQTWMKCILPQWISKIRFPLYAVIAYSVSVVDLALILGPTHPPTFAMLLWQWFNEPDLMLFPRAAAGGVVLFCLAFLLIAFVRLIEYTLTQGFKSWQYSGRFGFGLAGKTKYVLLLSLFFLVFPILILWSVAQRWRFPDLLPSRYSFRFWQAEAIGIQSNFETSLMIALIAGTFALLFAVIAHEYRDRYTWHLPAYVIVIPMIVPQLSLLFGLQVGTLYFDNEYYLFWVCWSHVFFAFPYVYLSLDGPWRSYDQRLTRMALSLGKSPLYAWIHVKFPQLLTAVMMAWAMGISVSLAQYLPTLLLGAGRISTLTTEAVALSSGFDRRVTAIYALGQAILPFLFFAFAYWIGHQKGKWMRKLRA